MPKVLDEDQLRRKQQLAEKRAARKQAKEDRGQKEAAEEAARKAEEECKRKEENPEIEDEGDKECHLLKLPEDAMHHLFQFLSAAELGRLTLAGKYVHDFLGGSRASIVFSRLRTDKVELLSSQTDAEKLLETALSAGGETDRIITKGKYARSSHAEFISYARFLEEAVSGYGVLANPKREKDEEYLESRLAKHVEGRFVSVSPEHSLCRVGGDGDVCGAGGSGVASWGVGRRGQLGHGKREDQDLPPKRLMGGFGYGIRIVQVAAGGGLVRVAHSLLLSSTGQVYSFGTGQYGALGHGYSSAKQLPDQIRPTLIRSLASEKCIGVAAGELHSAAVTSDGDLYTWGDGFCGQLGRADKRPQVEPKQVTHGYLEDECVATVSCGSRHTIAITEEGEVFTFGLGHFGVLGRSYTPFEYDADAAVIALGGEEGAPMVIPPLVPPAGSAPAIPNHVDEAATNEGLGEGVARPMPAPLVVPVEEAPPNPAAPRAAERDLAEELRQHLDLIANLSLDDSSDQCIPKRVDALAGIKIVQGSAGHRHTLLLDDQGGLYSCGAGTCGCLGHGDTLSQSYPVRITSFDDDNIRIRQVSAGVDTSMAVSTTGQVFAWGKPDGGRIGLGLLRGQVTHPRRVPVLDANGQSLTAVEVTCSYVHSLIACVDGTVHLCGNVGIKDEPDSQREEEAQKHGGKPKMIENYNIWHRLEEPKEIRTKPKNYKKYGKYEIKGRSKMVAS